MTVREIRTLIALAGIVALRIMGLFMILPVFALYAEHLPDTTPFLVGMAIGIYGLTQAVAQIPMGMLSDHFGRKPIITIGLVTFALGSVLAAVSTSLIGIIIGRALQGCGAISAAVLALVADLTREEHRTQAMGFIGVSIGMSFILAMAISPLLNQWIGVPGIFWSIAILSTLAIGVLYIAVPQPVSCRFHRETEAAPTQFKQVLSNPQLLRLNLGVLILHLLLTALFVVLPLLLKNLLDVAQHWQIYVPVMFIAIIIMLPCIILAEKYRQTKILLIGAIVVLGLSELGLAYWYNSLIGIVFMLILLFAAFTLLEASLPSLISKIAPITSKGTAMGVYASSQFLGAFIGGMSGGWLHQHYGIEAIFAFCAGLTVLWLVAAVTMQNPPHLRSHLLRVGQIDEQQANQLVRQLIQIPGVAEVAVILEDGIIYLKVDRDVLDVATLNQFAVVR